MKFMLREPRDRLRYDPTYDKDGMPEELALSWIDTLTVLWVIAKGRVRRFCRRCTVFERNRDGN